MIARALARRLGAGFVLALGTTASLLTVLQAMRLSPLVVAARASTTEWLEALGWAAVASLEAVAPAAFAVAAVLTVLRAHADGERLAARAAGLSPLQLGRAAILLVVVAAGALALVQMLVLPFGLTRLERAWTALVPRALAGALPAGELAEVVPGTVLWARSSGGAGLLDDLVVARGDEVLAARRARLQVARGPTLVIRAEDAAWRRGQASARASALSIALDVRAVTARTGTLVPRGDGPRHGPWGRALAPLSFGLVAIAVLLLALLWADRPVRLVLSTSLMVGAREASIRLGEAAAGTLGTAGAALVPVVATGAVALMVLALARGASRRGW